jgi:hypothetical protein
LTRSQFKPALVLTPTEKPIADPSVLVTATFWNEDPLEPAVTLKEAAFGLNTSRGLLLTTSVTAIVCGGFEAPEGVTVMVPVYVAGVKPAVFTLTTKLPGAMPLLGEALNHCCAPVFCAATV